MAAATYLRRLWLLTLLGVMVSLLFGTVHPVQPGISARGTSGRVSASSRFDSWSDALGSGHEDDAASVEDRGTVGSVVASADAPDSPSGFAMLASGTPRLALADDQGLVVSATKAPIRSRTISTSSPRAPPRA